MRKLLVAVFLAGVLTGCATETKLFQQAESFTITQASVDGLRAGYDGAFLTPAAHYRQLGYCAAGKAATLQRPCADKAIVGKLRAADNAVQDQFVQVQGMIDAGQNSGLGAAYETLKGLIQTAESVAANAGVK